MDTRDIRALQEADSVFLYADGVRIGPFRVGGLQLQRMSYSRPDINTLELSLLALDGCENHSPVPSAVPAGLPVVTDTDEDDDCGCTGAEDCECCCCMGECDEDDDCEGCYGTGDRKDGPETYQALFVSKEEPT
jgi:hypothetical protein